MNHIFVYGEGNLSKRTRAQNPNCKLVKISSNQISNTMKKSWIFFLTKPRTEYNLNHYIVLFLKIFLFCRKFLSVKPLEINFQDMAFMYMEKGKKY